MLILLLHSEVLTRGGRKPLQLFDSRSLEWRKHIPRDAVSDTVVSSQEDSKRNREGSKSEERKEEKKDTRKKKKEKNKNWGKTSQEGRITRGCFHVLKKSSYRRRSVHSNIWSDVFIHRHKWKMISLHHLNNEELFWLFSVFHIVFIYIHSFIIKSNRFNSYPYLKSASNEVEIKSNSWK